MKNFFFPLAIAITMLCCFCDASNNSTTTTTDNSISDVNTTTIIPGETSKDENEIKELADAGIDIIKSGIDVKRRNDSIRNSNKQRVWVYQIGGPMSNEELAADRYEKLKDIPHLYIFKRSKHELYLIKDDGYSTNQQLIDSFNVNLLRVENISPERLQPIDLSLQCPPKEVPTLSKPVKYKVNGQRKEIECRTCE